MSSPSIPPRESRPFERLEGSSPDVSSRPPIRPDAVKDAEAPSESRTLASPDDWRGTDLDLRDVV